MTRFWTSDTHFGHARINDLSGRPFSSVDEMNEALVENWNRVVGPSDLVIHLGDVALGTIADSLPIVGRLNGTKILVPGNHDRIFPTNKQNQIDRFSIQYGYFFNVMPVMGNVVTLDDGTVCNVSHFPYKGDHGDQDRYPEFRPVDDGLPLLHGHVHELWKVKGNMFNVGVDVRNFQPVSEDAIIDWVQTL